MNVPDGARVAAQRILADATQLNVEQAHEVVLRDLDANEPNPRLVTFLPLGDALGIGIRRNDDPPHKDADFAFVSMKALGTILPALGFVATGPAVAIGPRETPAVSK